MRLPRLGALLTVILAAVSSGSATVAADHPLDACLELSDGAVSTLEWAAVEEAVASALAERPALFPEPAIIDDPPRRLNVYSGHVPRNFDKGAACLEPGSEWTARFARDFLEAGADQMLAEAPTTPGIDSSVDLEWYPDEARVQTTLVFAGPLDFPNGTCWVDDQLTLDAATGTVLASADQGVETSLFAEGACRRFFDHLPDGGAGEQAVTILPRVVSLADGSTVRFVAEEVQMRDDAIIVMGTLARD